MFARRLPLLFALGLAGLAWPLLATAYQFGVMNAKARAEPAQIEPGGNARISVVANDGLQKPVASATVTISAATGYFEASNENVVIGYTDQDGAFQTVWHSNLQTPSGAQTFQVTTVKNGYISKFPVTATTQVIVVGDPPPSGDPARGNPGFPAP